MTTTNEQSYPAKSIDNPYYFSERYATQEEFDIIGYTLEFFKRWKLFGAVTFCGVVFSIVVALLIPREYMSTVVITLPSPSSAEVFAEKGLKNYSQQELMNEFYDKIRSPSFFRSFLVSQGYLKKLFPVDFEKQNIDSLFYAFTEDFNIEINEPEVGVGEYVSEPTRFTVSLRHSDEKLLVEMLNAYVVYTNRELLQDLQANQQSQRESKLAVLRRQWQLLKSREETIRNLKIKKIEAENEEKLAVLQQRKQLLVAKANEDRRTQISVIEEDNRKKLAEMEQKKLLLIAKVSQDRASDIAIAEEALKIAQKLDIIYPTRLDNFKKRANASVEAKTNITLSDNQSLPLYLMGTKYLETLIKTLRERKEDAVFIKELNTINSEIAKVKDDKALSILKNRRSDAPFLTELNQINREIAEVENDKRLTALKQRTDDEPFIAELPAVMNSITSLELLPIDFSKVNAYTVVKPALLTNKAVKPKRKVIVMIGGVLSVLFAFLVTVVYIAASQREQRRQKHIELTDGVL